MTISLSARTKIGRIELVPASKKGQVAANSLFCAEAGLLVDSGAEKARLAPLAPTIRTILYTHFHGDHRWHSRLFDHAETWAHALEAPPLETKAAFLAANATQGPVAQIFDAFFEGSLNPVRVDRRITGEDTIDFAGVSVTPMHLPGHTPGLLCPYFPEERLLFLTDYDLTRFGPWYGNRTGNLDDFEASLARIAAFDADWFMTSHLPGALTRDDMLALLEPFRAEIPKRDARLVEELASPRTLEDLATLGICYRKEHLEGRSPILTWFEQSQLEHHLRRLERRGAVGFDGERWVRA